MDWELRLLSGAAAGYGLASLAYLVGLFSRRRVIRSAGPTILFLSWALHSVSLALRIAEAHRLPLQSSYDLLLWFGWWLAVVYLVVEDRTRVSLPGLLIAGLSFAISAGRLLRMGSALVPPLPQQVMTWFALHAVVLYAAYACLVVAVAIELSSLFFGPLTSHESRVPVERQERYLEFRSYAYRLVLFAFPFLSLAIISNALWRSAARGHYWAWGQEETWALVTWIMAAAYLHLRTQVRTGKVLATIFSLLSAGSITLTFTGVTWLARLIGK
jgi:ABC-type transport system involved in cytochrome c biogenesis permease subunit